MNHLSRLIACVILMFGAIGAIAQSFSFSTTQTEIVAVAGFNHTPLRVGVVTNVGGLNMSTMVASSDSSWVIPAVDATASEIVLSFNSSNLINSTYTATITAILAGETNSFFVKASISPVNITRLKDDPLRSRTYGIQQNGVQLGSLVAFDPVTTNYIGNVTVGKQPTDFAESDDGTELFVINCADETITVIDLQDFTVKETLTLPVFDNWGLGSTTANIAVGPTNVLYYTDGAWAPALRVLNRATSTVIQTIYADGPSGNGLGDIGVSSDKAVLFGWMQYGWSAGLANSYVTRFTISADGMLTHSDSGPSQYNSMFGRDPLETPVLVTGDDQIFFIKGFAVGSDSASNVKYTFPAPVYSITPGGEIAATATAIYETVTGIKLADLPKNAPVQAISSDYSRLVYFDSTARVLKTLNLLEMIGPGIINQGVVPADGAITLSPPQLEWSPLPGVDRYNVYLGQSETEVASATTNSAAFLGQVSQPFYQLAGPLTPGVTYFWRVDAVSQFDVTTGDVKEFTVSLISCTPTQIDVATVQGHSDFKTTLELASASPGLVWKAAGNQSWVSFTQSTGNTPATVEVVLDASQLAPGLHQASVIISNDASELFTIPVSMRVDALKTTVMESDPQSAMVYAISEDTTTTPARAYLLELDSATETIRRVVRVGSSATDLAVHKGDNRVYVPNWLGGTLLAIDLNTFQQVRSYAFAPFGGTGYSQGDIYKVAAGGAGRLVWEEEDQWIDINIFDTVNATNLSTAFVREGGGAIGGNGRYYYHGDNNSSGAALHKFDMLGDQFVSLASIRVSSVSYYGSRTVVVSEDGSRVFWNGSAFDANLTELWTMADEVFSTSPDGRYAFSQTKVYDTVQKLAVLGMPLATSVSAFNSTTDKLVVQNGGALRFYPVTTPLSLPAPALVAVATNYNSVTFNWDDRSLEDSFTMQQRVQGSASWTDLPLIAQNTNQITVSGLAQLTTYEFRIKANAPTVSSAWSSVVTITTPAIPPTTPSLNIPSATPISVTLSWSNPSYETAIVVERSTGNASNWVVIATLPADSISLTDSNVAQLVTYYYRVKGSGPGGDSAYSTIRSITVPTPPLPTVPAMSSPTISPDFVAVYWSNPSYEHGIVLERSVGSTTNFAVLALLPADSTGLVDTNVVWLTTYYYRVKATNDVGSSAYSTTVAATVPTPPPPAIPTGLVASPLSRSTVGITWNTAAGATGYRLERRTEDPASWEVAALLPSNQLSYTNTGLVQGMQYWFRVQGTNNVGASGYSNEDDATPADIVKLIEDDFDPALDPGVWAAISGGGATNGGQGFQGSNALHFGATGTRSAATIPLEIYNDTAIEFSIRAGNQNVDGNTFWNNSETGETVVLEYSKDNGITWTPIQTLNTVYPSLTNWISYSISVPVAAYGPATQFRWRQLANSGASFDCWALDDVVVRGAAPLPPAPVPFVISSPNSSSSIGVFWVGAAGATHYVVERKSGQQPWSIVALVPTYVTYFIDSALTPSTPYSYRIQASNASGSAAYSPTTTSFTWSQIQQWLADNYGSPEALTVAEMTLPAKNGCQPILRYAFNLTADEPLHLLEQGQNSGFPRIWLDHGSGRIWVEFVCRKPSMQPGISYEVQFSHDALNWESSGLHVSTAPIDDLWERVYYMDSLGVSNAASRYCRVTVSLSP